MKTRADEVAPFIDCVQHRADTERDALGFLPQAAYQEAAVQGKLWVAVKHNAFAEVYMGHLLFGGAFPNIRVFQVFVEDEYRRSGVASALIDHLIADAEAHSYLRITARVADDLAANRFWENKGFSVVRSQLGGSVRGRLILLREKRLCTPTLFDLLHASSTPTDHDLRLAERLYVRSPMFAIDLNVLLDVVRDRPRARAVRMIIAAAMANTIRLSVAPEFIAELQKASIADTNDPLLEFSSGLPQLPAPPSGEITRLTIALAAIVFPGKSRCGRLKARDHADLRHLATAIHHRTTGFITSEKAILRCQRLIREEFELDVVGPTELAEALTPDEWKEHEHVTARPAAEAEMFITEVRENDRQATEHFLRSAGLDDRMVADSLSPGHRDSPRRRLVVVQNDTPSAFASWDAPQKATPCIDALLLASAKTPDTESAVDHALFLLHRDAAHCGPTVIRLCVRAGDTLVEELVASSGFRPEAAGGQAVVQVWQKICLGKVVVENTWTSVRQELRKLARIELSHRPPEYRGFDTPISITSPQGAALCLPLHEFEELVGPAILLLPHRMGAIVPIRALYAEQLLDTSPQQQIFPKYEAGLLFQRAYFSNTRTLKVLSPGTILLFYESKHDSGRGAVVACGRATANSIRPTHDVSDSIRRRGVLEDASLKRIGKSGRTCATIFDMVMRFETPVPLERLRAMGCADGSNLVTSRSISYDQTRTLLADGHPCL